MDLEQALSDLYDKQEDIAKQKLDNIINHYDYISNRSQAVADNAKATIDLYKAMGREITAADYNYVLSGYEETVATYEQKRSALNAEFVNLISQGVIKQGTEVWDTYKSKIESIDKAIIDMNKSIVETKKAIAEIPITNLGYVGNKLSAIQTKIEKLNELNEVQGYDIDKERYKQLIENGHAQIKNLEEQNRLYKQQMKTIVDANSTYSEYAKKISSTTSSISALNASNAAANKTLAEQQKAYDELAKEYSSYNDAWVESSSSGATYENIKDIEKGAKGDVVKVLQGALKDQGYNLNKYGVDGNFGKETQSAVKAFQKANGLEETGVVDSSTWAALGKAQGSGDAYAYYLKSENDRIIEQAKAINESMQKTQDIISTNNQEISQLQKQANAFREQQQASELNRIDAQLEKLRAELKSAKVNSELYESLQKQIAALEEEREAVQINSEEYQNYLDKFNDNEQKILEIKKQQEEWNDLILELATDELDKLKDQLDQINEKYERQRKLQQAIEDLNKAQTQRTIRQYVEGVGYMYVADNDEIQKARENLDSVLHDETISKMDDIIDAIGELKYDNNIYDAEGNLLGQKVDYFAMTTEEIIAEAMKSMDAATNLSDMQKQILNSVASSVTSNATNISIGDIVLQGVENENDLAQAIVNNFSSALTRALYSK